MTDRRAIIRNNAAAADVGAVGDEQVQLFAKAGKLYAQLSTNDSVEIIDLSSPVPKVPVGSVICFGGQNAPSHWLLCDGTAYDGSSGTDYEELYGVLGNTYGGTDATDFKVPDGRGRVLVAPDGGQGRISANNAMGNVGGDEEHSLATSELPAHSHANTVSTSGVTTTISGGVNIYGVGTYGHRVIEATTGLMNAAVINSASSLTATTTVPVSITNANAGGGGSHNNLQPYLVAQYIIKFKD